MYYFKKNSVITDDNKFYPKLWLIDYFESLVQQVDIDTETLIVENDLNEAEIEKLNSTRDYYINEIVKAQAKNLSAYDKKSQIYEAIVFKDQSEETIDKILKDIFEHYCFLLNKDDLQGVEQNAIGVLFFTRHFLNDSELNDFK
jgi:hypothetical protein